MGARHKLDEAVGSVRHRLLMEWFVRTFVRALAAGVSAAALLLAVSRLFVWPGYAGYAVMIAVFAAVGVFVYDWRKAPSRLESVRLLDSFGSDNVILAAETDRTRKAPLSAALSDAAVEASDGALERFRKRKGRWTERRPLLITSLAAGVLAVLALFPSPAQLEAREVEEEQRIIEDLAENVRDLADRAEEPEMENRLGNLVEEIESAASPEEAIREAVKLQRELSLDERQADRPLIQSGQTEGQRILTPGEAAAALAALSGDAEEQLARMGRTPGSGEQALSGEEGQGSPEKSEGQEGASPGGGNDSGTESEGNATGGSGGGQPGNNGGGSQDGSGNGTDSGNGAGAEVQSNGNSGSGSGSGNNVGDGSGSGGEGSGYGSGQGDRNFVSTPQSPPDPGDPVLDTGPQKEGTSASDAVVPAEKGEVRPYSEVQSDYLDAYVEHAGRLGLPEDLQQVLSDYFSSIDAGE